MNGVSASWPRFFLHFAKRTRASLHYKRNIRFLVGVKADVRPRLVDGEHDRGDKVHPAPLLAAHGEVDSRPAVDSLFAEQRIDRAVAPPADA